MDETKRTIPADRGDEGRRIDMVIRRHLADVPRLSRTRVQSWIEEGRVTLNGAPVRRASARAALGDAIVVDLPDIAPRRVMAAESDAPPLHVLFEDEHLLAIDKPAGIVVHPSYRNHDRTLMNALLWYAREWTGGRRPSLVGRLDKDTSGIVLVSKSSRAHAALQKATAQGAATKEYLAVVYGHVSAARGSIELALGADPEDRRRTVSSPAGAPSLTTFERLARVPAPDAGLALLKCTLGTGRRHQIRTHLAARSWPIVGDPVYGEPRWKTIADPRLAEALRTFPRQALHAFRLSFVHPFGGERLSVTAPVPRDMTALLHAAGLEDGVPDAHEPERARPTGTPTLAAQNQVNVDK